MKEGMEDRDQKPCGRGRAQFGLHSEMLIISLPGCYSKEEDNFTPNATLEPTSVQKKAN